MVFNLAGAVSQETMSPWLQCSELSMYKVYKCIQCQPRSLVLPAKGSSRVVPVYCSTGRDSLLLFYKGCSHVSHVSSGAWNEPLRSLKLYNHGESYSQDGVRSTKLSSNNLSRSFNQEKALAGDVSDFPWLYNFKLREGWFQALVASQTILLSPHPFKLKPRTPDPCLAKMYWVWRGSGRATN